MPIMLAIVVFLVPAVMTSIWYWRIAKFRIDILPGESPTDGDSVYWLLNVLRARNYSHDGQRPLRWFWFWAVVWQLSLFVDLIILVTAYP